MAFIGQIPSIGNTTTEIQLLTYLRISTYLGTAMQNFRTLLKTEDVVVVLVVSDRKNEYNSVRYFLLRFLPASLHLTTTTTATF